MAACCAALVAFAQARPMSPIADLKPEFTTVKAAPITSVKNQGSSGTCWSFSGTSFFESEAIRINDIPEDQYPSFAPFFTVAHSYYERGLKYVMMDGKLNFSVGSSCDDVRHVVEDYGLVPYDLMTGLNYGTDLPRQAEFDAVLAAFIEAVAKNPNRTLSTAWKTAYASIISAYLGEYPEEFEVNGTKYTPESYRDSFNLNMDDYVSFSSYTHHPFYEPFVIEVCDNWRFDSVYNVPIDEMMAIIDNALENGYTIAWGADVSHTGFTRNGLGIFIDVEATTKAAQKEVGSDQARFVGGDAPQAQKVGLSDIVEAEPSQEQRQHDYENKILTDDHGMHIFGIAKDENGKKYYMVKNSWGTASPYEGIWYVTEAYVKGQTMDFMVHKDAVPKDIAKKCGISK